MHRIGCAVLCNVVLYSQIGAVSPRAVGVDCGAHCGLSGRGHVVDSLLETGGEREAVNNVLESDEAVLSAEGTERTGYVVRRS